MATPSYIGQPLRRGCLEFGRKRRVGGLELISLNTKLLNSPEKWQLQRVLSDVIRDTPILHTWQAAYIQTYQVS